MKNAYLEDGANTARAGFSLSGFDFEALIGANVTIRLNSENNHHCQCDYGRH